MYPIMSQMTLRHKFVRPTLLKKVAVCVERGGIATLNTQDIIEQFTNAVESVVLT